MRTEDDAFGHAILDYYEGRHRDEAGAFGCRTWFAAHRDWFARERKAIRRTRGRILDVGCAAGRHTLYLQERGHDVVAIDNSPLAIEVCRRRGVRDAHVASLTQLSARWGTFDTILMLGNNFGLMGSPRRARWMLRRFDRMTPGDGIILAGAGDVRGQPDPACRSRVADNVRDGRLPGEFRLRKRYRGHVTPPIPWLYASKADVEAILDGTAWRAAEFFDDEPPGSAFVALMVKRG